MRRVMNEQGDLLAFASQPMTGQSNSQTRYAGYSADATEKEVRRLFKLRYYRDPVEVSKTAGCWLAGPLTWEEWATQD